MFKLTSLLLCFSILPTLVLSQGNLFKKDIKFGNNRVRLNDMCNTSDGYVLIGGTARNHLFLAKMKLNGDTVWTKSLDRKAGILLYATIEHFDNTYVTSGVWANSVTRSNNGFLTRHDSLGNVIWSVSSSTGTKNTRWWAAAVGPDSSIATVGYRDNGDDYGLISKFDASGNLLWTKEAILGKGLNYDRVAFDKLGNIIAVGHTNSGGSVVTKLSPTGTVLWNKATSAHIDGCRGLEILPSGNILVCGSSNPVKFKNVFLHKLSPNGNLLLAKQYWINSYCEPNDIQLTDDNKVMVYGETITPFGTGLNYQNMVMELDTNGKQNWSYCYGDTIKNESNTCGLFVKDGAHWVGSYVDTDKKDVIFKATIYLFTQRDFDLV